MATVQAGTCVTVRIEQMKDHTPIKMAIRPSLKRKTVTPNPVPQPSDALPLRAIPPCPMSPATMLPTAENATAADGKEAGVPFVFPPRPPPSLLSSARGARRSVPSHAAADALTCAGAARDDDDDDGDDRAR